MNLLNWWCQRGWQLISQEEYRTAYKNWGGSLATHPDFIEKISDLVSTQTEYFGYFDNQTLMAALPTWGRFIAGHKRALKKMGRYQDVDLGNMEIILPISPTAKTIPLHFKIDYLSTLHQSQISTLKSARHSLSLLKNFNQEFSRKFIYNRKRELRLLQENGIEIIELSKLSAEEIGSHYSLLFEKRWEQLPRASHNIIKQLDALKDYLIGFALFKNRQPIAIQMVFCIETTTHISAEFINAGVDLAFNQLSPGSVLTFINTEWASQFALDRKKPLRYSFGILDQDYKKLWCNSSPVFRT